MSVSFFTAAASVFTAVTSVIGARKSGGGGGVPARREDKTGPVARSTSDVQSQERQRAAVFKRLSRLRRSTLVSERSAAEPQILSQKLGGG